MMVSEYADVTFKRYELSFRKRWQFKLGVGVLARARATMSHCQAFRSHRNARVLNKESVWRIDKVLSFSRIVLMDRYFPASKYLCRQGVPRKRIYAHVHPVQERL